jgi:hypothetical protein
MKQGLALLGLLTQPHWFTISAILIYTGFIGVFAPRLVTEPIPLQIIPSMPAVMLWLTLVAQIGYPQSDLTAPGSGYPEFLLRLPMTNRALALWPALAAMAGSAALWFGLCYGYFGRLGIHVPTIFVIGFAEAVVGAILVMSWHPFALGLFRAVGIGIAILGLGELGLWWFALHLPVSTISERYGAISVAEAVLGCYSVALARRNAGFGLSRLRLAWWKSAEGRERRPFSSARGAEFWMQWKLRGRVFPYAVLAYAVLISIPLILMREILDEVMPYVEVNGWISSGLPALVLGILLISVLVRPDAVAAQQDKTAFFYTLPVTDAEILASKSFEQTFGAAFAWVVLVVTSLGWLMLPADDHGADRPFLFVLIRSFPVHLFAAVPLGLALLFALLWRNRTGWTFSTCFRELKYTRLFGIASILVPTYTALPFLLVLLDHGLMQSWLQLLPWVLGVLVALKVAVAYGMWRRLTPIFAPGPGPSLRFIGWWAVSLVLLVSAVEWLVSRLPSVQVGTTPNLSLTAALGTILLAPLARPMLARLILHSTRHG